MNNRLFVAVVAVGAAFAFVPTGAASAMQSDTEKREAKCSGGDSYECQLLGNSYKLGLYVAKDPVKARSAYERGCKPEDWTTGTSCAELYRMVSLGEGGPKDPAKARLLKPKACNSGIIAQQIYLEGLGLCEKK